AEAEETEIALQWEGADEVVRVTVAPGQSRVFPAPGRGGKTGVGELKVGGAVLYYAGPVETEVKVWVSGGKVEERGTRDAVFFLARALKADPRRSFVFVDDVGEAGLIVLTEGVADPGPVVERVGGKGARVLAVANAETRGVLSALLGEGLVVEEAKVDDYSLLEGLDFEHPLMGAFADPTLRDFSKIRSWKHRSVELGEGVEHAVVARFDDGDPAWIDVRLGEGRMFLLSSGWQPADSQLALSSKFVPLLFSVLEGTGVVSSETGAMFMVGEEGLLAELGGTESVTVTDPEGEAFGHGREEAFQFERAGRYRVERNDGSRFEVTANLPVSEGVLAPVGREELVEMGVLLDDGKPAVRENEKDEEERAAELAMETEERQKLWRWIVVGLFVVLMIETILAGRRVVGSEGAGEDGAIEGVMP
ncbi:MAG: hypothetical protein P8J87_07895, partial [Verrucomicrobiales bacterium]|nr:hypothetical protein [Verrucomicrobiales bacterium]